MATEPLEEALLHIATNPVLAQRGAQPIGETAPTGIDSAVLEQAKGIFESLDSKGKDELRQEQERILTRKSSIQPKPQLVSEEEPEPVERLAMPARGSRPDLRDSVDAAALEGLIPECLYSNLFQSNHRTLRQPWLPPRQPLKRLPLPPCPRKAENSN
jgi:hypothetical protein